MGLAYYLVQSLGPVLLGPDHLKGWHYYLLFSHGFDVFFHYSNQRIHFFSCIHAGSNFMTNFRAVLRQNKRNHVVVSKSLFPYRYGTSWYLESEFKQTHNRLWNG